MPATLFESRLQALRAEANVLPLDEGLKRLAAGTLPDRSVAVTVDDGFSDFYARGWPLLAKYQLHNRLGGLHVPANQSGRQIRR
jgi:peptidoglycan/xylan/chitin deacetylase (PgdA/CDA1 family)